MKSGLKTFVLWLLKRNIPQQLLCYLSAASLAARLLSWATRDAQGHGLREEWTRSNKRTNEQTHWTIRKQAGAKTRAPLIRLSERKRYDDGKQKEVHRSKLTVPCSLQVSSAYFDRSKHQWTMALAFASHYAPSSCWIRAKWNQESSDMPRHLWTWYECARSKSTWVTCVL